MNLEFTDERLVDLQGGQATLVEARFEATARAIDADGWLHTGDVGRLDEQGRLTITDRKKDMFLVGGFNTYPAEIELVLGAHPAGPLAERVRDACRGGLRG